MTTKKEVFLVILLVILVVSCSQTAKEVPEIELPKEITDLKKSIELYPQNQTLKHKLGVQLYNFYLEQAIQKNMSKDNLPFLLHNENNSAGCLLIHGFTATPLEVKELGDYLYSQNISVYGALLAGHGTTPQDLDKTTWQDWYKSSEQGLELLSHLTKSQYICGQSLGASLAINLAQENDVAGVVLIASPIYLKDKRAKLAFLLAPFNFYKENKLLKDNEKEHYYEKRSAKSIAELIKLIEANKKGLNKVTAPILIIQAREDTRIKLESAYYIYDNIGSSDKKIMIVDEAEHVLTTGNNNKKVFEEIAKFIKEKE